VLDGGFDHSYLLGDQDRFFSPRRHELDDRPLPAIQSGSDFYATTAIAQRAIDMLKQHEKEHRDQPVFLYLCFTCPHFPIQAPAEDIARYRDTYRVGWDVIRQRRWERQQELGLVPAALSPPDRRTIPPWNLSAARLKQQVGPAEVAYAVRWNELTAEQQDFQAAKMAVHAAMVDRMDQEIGRVLGQLRSMQALEDTIILFLSDNGASAEQIIRADGHDPTAPIGSARTFLGIGPGWSTVANTPLRLHKSWVHEGGIATPLIVHWPRRLSARGELRHNPGHLIDLVPTLLQLAGGNKPDEWDGEPIPPAPGRSLVPVFTQDGTVSHDYLWWYHAKNRAIRMGNWKLVSQGDEGPWELYDLSHDRSELSDLSASNPAKAKELAAAWTQHAQEFRELASKDSPAVGKKKPRP
jgi:arylsulfatase A-like enzyme